MARADTPAGTRAPSSIETDMEATRQRLAGTIDQLLFRASPKTIARREVASLKARFVAPDGSPRTGTIVKVAGGALGLVAMLVVVRKVTH